MKKDMNSSGGKQDEMTNDNDLEIRRFLAYFEKIIRTADDDVLDKLKFSLFVEMMERTHSQSGEMDV